jgi:uncharacterized membrane protein YtjA (UPF0391 family)
MDLLTWAIIAIVVAVIAGALGFTGVAAGAATIAKWLFIIFLILAVILFVMVFFGIGILDNVVDTRNALDLIALSPTTLTDYRNQLLHR